MRTIQKMRKFVASFRAAFRGIGLVVRNERNFRIHICFIFYVLVFALLGSLSVAKCAVIFACFGLVTAAELVNSAIELLCDTVSDRFDAALRAIKDMAAGAVLMCAVCAAAAGLFIFLESETFKLIFARLYAMPYIAAGIAVSIPLAVLFVTKRRK